MTFNWRYGIICAQRSKLWEFAGFGKSVTIFWRSGFDTIFEAINLDDQDVCHKVWKLFQENEENEFLRDDVFRIAEKYDMRVVARRSDGLCVKKLIKK